MSIEMEALRILAKNKAVSFAIVFQNEDGISIEFSSNCSDRIKKAFAHVMVGQYEDAEKVLMEEMLGIEINNEDGYEDYPRIH